MENKERQYLPPLAEVGDKEKSARKTNYNTDGLEGWDISIR